MAGPCTGLTVLDFSLGMPGAVCTLVLADFGAEVIKIEPPGGDPFRFQPAWISWNRGKKGVVLDLETAEGREQAIRLAADADVLVESFRPGDMARWGLSYEDLARLCPRLVYCSVTGFGQEGPLRRVKGYEGLVAAKAGRSLNMQGQPNREGPVYSAVQTGSWHASQAAVRGILAALRVRDLCGRGQWAQTSIVQALASPHDNNVGDGGLVNMQLRRRDPERFPGRPGGNRGLSSIGYIPVRTGDGTWLQHANQRVPHIQGHLKAIGLGHLLEDERFERVPAIDIENRELLRREILQKQREDTSDNWMELYLRDGNIAAEPYRDSVQAMDHPAVISNGTVVTINDPRVGPMRTLAPLVDLKETAGQPSGPAPDVGQHNAEVLGSLGSAPAAGTDSVSEPVDAHVPAHPLSGVTVLDLSTIQAGPYGASLLADLGARVIKVDATDRRLDEGRRSTAQAIAEPRTYAGKEGIQVDLQTPEGKAIIHKLIAAADVLLHNFRLGVPERLQIDWETCQNINPRMVHVWMGTYGENGEHASRPGAHPIPGAIMGGAFRQMGARHASATGEGPGPRGYGGGHPLDYEVQLGAGPEHLARPGHRDYAGPAGAGPYRPGPARPRYHAQRQRVDQRRRVLRLPGPPAHRQARRGYSRPSCPVPALPLPRRVGLPRLPVPGRVGGLLPRRPAGRPAGRPSVRNRGSPAGQ